MSAIAVGAKSPVVGPAPVGTVLLHLDPPPRSSQLQSVALASASNTISGRVVNADYEVGRPDLKLTFYAKGLLGSTKIGSTTTDLNGDFVLPCNLTHGCCTKTLSLVIDVVEVTKPFAELGCPTITQDKTVDTLTPNLPVKEGDLSLGTLRTKANNIPEDLANVPSLLPNQVPSTSYFLHLIRAAAPEIPKRLFVAAFEKCMSASSVQAVYDHTLCGLIGYSYEKIKLSENILKEELLNRICHNDYRIDGNQVIFETHWDEAYFIRQDSLAHTSVVFNISLAAPAAPVVQSMEEEKKQQVVYSAEELANCSLEFSHISVRYPDEGEATVTYKGTPNYPKALKDAVNNFAYDGEGRYHLGFGHMLASVPAQAKDTYLTEANPIKKVLAPHLTGTLFIDNLGNGAIFGQGGVLARSAYSIEGVNRFIIGAASAKANWQNYVPPAPISKDDKRSRAESICFEVMMKFFTHYVNENRNEILSHWKEIYNWSRYMNSRMTTLPLITETLEPTEIDFQNLAKFCAWLVNTTTFIHWSAHSRQQILTDVSQASLAVRNKGLKENGEVDPFSCTSVDDASAQLFTGRVLLGYRGNGILKNPSVDVDPYLITCFNERLAELKALYPDFEEMFVRVDI